MKYGFNRQTQQFYAAQYNPESGRVEVVATGPTLAAVGGQPPEEPEPALPVADLDEDQSLAGLFSELL